MSPAATIPAGSQFQATIELPCSPADAFDYHEHPVCLSRLLPPWQNVRVAKPSTSLAVGQQVELQIKQFGISTRWLAEHVAYDPPLSFADIQQNGPLAHWRHEHAFTPTASGCRLTDSVDFRLPSVPGRRLLEQHWLMPQLANMFKFRHQRTLHDLQLRQQTRVPLHVGVSGASGLMGRELCQTLGIAGHRATRLLRCRPKLNSDAAAIIAWPQQTDSTTTPLPAESQQTLEQLDAVVHLAGMPIAQRRWNAATKREIRDSRVDLTHQLCRQLATLKSPPQTLICASATGIYGDREDEVLTEASRAGQGFLASVAEEWESACRPAVEAGIRVVHARFGIVLSARGGALQRTLLPTKLCGGHLGHGHQWWSWIAIDDAVRAILHLLTNTQVSGPVNMVAPEAVQQREFARTLGKVLGRPALLPAPRFALRLALGEMADELLLTSTRVAPEALHDSGFRFLFPELESALRFQTGRFERAAS